MAKQQGIFKFTGTIQNVTGYEMNGRFYIKAKSEVPRRKIRYDACFANTRRAQRYFAQAQKLAKEVYTRHMQREDRYLKNWYRLRNRAQDLLRTDMPREEALKILMAEFVRVPLEMKNPSVKKYQQPVAEPPAEIQLGRAFGRIDPAAGILHQLSALNLLMNQVLQPNGNICLQEPRFKETTRLRNDTWIKRR